MFINYYIKQNVSTIHFLNFYADDFLTENHIKQYMFQVYLMLAIFENIWFA